MIDWLILVNGVVALKQRLILNKCISIALIFISFFVNGQSDDLYDHGLDEKKWEDIREGIRYEGREGQSGRRWTYESDQEYNKDRLQKGESLEEGSGNGDGEGQVQPQERPRSSSSPRSNIRPSASFFNGLGFFGYLILAVFAVGLIWLIYKLFLNAESKGKKIDRTAIALEDINPTEIPLTELQRLLMEALAKQDYRGAVRIYFIFIVRDLAQKNWIQWQKEKTNFHYLMEMSGKADYDDFNQSVSFFEIIWYGERELDQSKFEEIRPVFTNFMNKLGVK